MKGDLSKVIQQTPPSSVEVGKHIKVHYHTIFLQAHQKVLYLQKIFQSVHSKFSDVLDHQ